MVLNWNMMSEQWTVALLYLLKTFLLCKNRHLLSLPTFRKRIYNFAQVCAESLSQVLWFLLQVGVNE